MQTRASIFNLTVLRPAFLGLMAALCFALLPGFSLAEDSRAGAEEPFLPYIEDYPNGRIDWDNGLLYGVGRGYLHLNMGSKDRALRVARALALQSILKVASGVRMDDSRTLNALGKGPYKIELKGLVQASEHANEFKADVAQPYYEITYVSSVKGVDGITSKLLGKLKSESLPWQDFPKKFKGAGMDDDELPWLVLDARLLPKQSKVEPALFPKVLSDTGEVIYELKEVDEESLTKRGMARYVESGATREELAAADSRFERVMARAKAMLGVGEAIAAEKEKRRKRQEYVVSEVKDVQGLTNTNLVISKNDVSKLQSADASGQILKQCRVIVIASSPIGGIEGRFLRYLAMANNVTIQ